MNKWQKEVIQSQLDSEKETISELKKMYEDALKDCETKIALLSARADLDPENLQSIIYQQRYQEAIKAQIEGVLEQLHTNEFATVSEYLQKCYEDGYLGVMYDIAGQGMPLILPMDQEQIVAAIQTDTKLSKSLYESLGEDIKALKKEIRMDISRGIAAGSSWNDIAADLAHSFKNTPLNKAYNRATTIARTEGHRIQCEAQLDAQKKAKENGCSIVKQWDSTLDGATRDTHRKLDGQIREVDDDFEVDGMRASAPGQFGDPSEDCNCRCQLLQRAKWALGEDELETLRDRAAFHGLDKTKDFDEFKEKYMKASGSESSESLEKPEESGTIRVEDTQIFRSVGARARNYDVVDPDTGDVFHFVEGSRIQNSQAFAGNGTKKPLHEGVAEGLSEQLGGSPDKWQHCKGEGVLNYFGEERKAEVHWFQEETVGKVKFKVKEWIDED